MRRLVPTALACLAALSSCLTPTSALAQAKAVAVTLYPDSLPAAMSGAADIQVLVANTSGGDLSGIRFSVVPIPGVRATIDTAPVTRLARDASLIRVLHVLAFDTTGRMLGGTPLLLRIDYGGPSAGTAGGVVLAPLRFVPGKYARAEDVADVQILSSLVYLSDRNDGSLYIVVHNKSDMPLSVGAPDIVPLADMQIVPDTTVLRARRTIGVAPYSTSEYPLRATADRRVTPGKHLVVIGVPLSWSNAGGRVQRVLVLSKEIDVGVFGESDILKLLGVPSLLVLPGFLVIMAMAVMWKAVPIGPRSPGAESPFKAATPEFWFYAISISLLIAGISYRVLGRWLLTSYGLPDLIMVWMFSAIGGAALYLAIAWSVKGIRRVRQARREQAARRRTPTAQDDPATLLDRLALRRQSLPSRGIRVDSAGTPAVVFPVVDDGTGTQLWVTPPIHVTWTKDDDEARKARDRFTELLEDGDPAAIAQLIRESEHARRLKSRWLQVDGVVAPMLIERRPTATWSDAPYIQSD